MNATIHEFAPEEIMAHYDGELSAARTALVSAHLHTCTECRELAESLRDTSQSLATWTIAPTPPLIQPHGAQLASTTATIADKCLSILLQPSRTRRTVLSLAAAAASVAFVLAEINLSQRSHNQHARMASASATQLDASKSDLSQAVDMVEGKGVPGGGGGGVHERGDALQRVSRSRLAAPSNSPFVGDYARAKAKSTDAPMIARTAELQIVVQQFDDARAALQSILARHQGYAAQLNVANMDNSARTLNASLRVPSQELSSALNELKSLGHVAHEAQSGEEVTAEHADLLARLKNSRETETRLQDILRNRTGKVSDVLEVEEEIARVRGEIEQMESERKTLDRRVDFATINVAITEEFKAKVGDSTPPVATQFRNAAIAGYKNVTESALVLLLWCAEYLPPILFWLLLLGVPAGWLWRRTQRALATAV